MTTNVIIQEANYVDPRAGNDKFYRVFVFGSDWVTQYGRNGTVGTFTKIITAASPEAARKAADAKFLSKVKKGYNPVRSGEVATLTSITTESLSALDTLAQSLPLGQTHTIVAEPVEPVDLQMKQLDDITAAMRIVLGHMAYRATQAEDINPSLPMRPMLAATAEPDQIHDHLLNNDWIAQYKYDGDRVVVEVINGEIRVLNRQGQEKVKNISHDHLLPFSALHSGRWVFDGEVVGRTLVLFDLAMASDSATTWVDERDSFEKRFEALQMICTALFIPWAESAPASAAIVLAPVSQSSEDKAQLLADATADQREGIMLRHRHGTYEPGRRSTTLIKHKFIKDADVIVTALHDTKESATLSVYDEQGILVEVGAASTIGKGTVSVGDVWVVTFLYVTDPEHPRLYQPRLVKQRTDKAAADCALNQFANAGTAKLV